MASTPGEIIAAIQSTALSPSERVEILRALKDTTPDLVAPDPKLEGRMRAALGTPAEFVESAINGLSASELWQQSAAATPIEIRKHLAFDDNRPVLEELTAYVDLLDYNVRYHHFAAIDMARTSYRVGKTIGGEAGLNLKPHLEIMGQHLPKVGRRKKKAAPPAPQTAPQPAGNGPAAR